MENNNSTPENFQQPAVIYKNADDDVWTRSDELILKEWSDKALCYRWMYEQAYHKYYVKLLWYMIPVIILSTLTGTANFAQERLPVEYQGAYAMIVGALNLFTAILTTIAQFLKVAELKEGFNIALRNWDKYNRALKLELMKKPSERAPKKETITNAKKDYDNLIDDSPILPPYIINLFINKFKDIEKKKKNKNIGSDNTDNLSEEERELDVLVLPEICDALLPTRIYKPTPEELFKEAQELNKSLERAPEPVTTVEEPEDKIASFRKMFSNKYGREPTLEEINDEMV